MQYDLRKKADRQRMRDDRRRELLAVLKGEWPRDINDRMRWMDPTPECAKAMCLADLDYLKRVEAQIRAGELSWEK